MWDNNNEKKISIACNFLICFLRLTGERKNKKNANVCNKTIRLCI